MMPNDKGLDTCPTCGSRVRIEGKTTMHYVPAAPVDVEREAEAFAGYTPDHLKQWGKSTAVENARKCRREGYLAGAATREPLVALLKEALKHLPSLDSFPSKEAALRSEAGNLAARIDAALKEKK